MKYAVAVLNIKPCEFWELTLAEFNVAMEAYQWKRRQEREMFAEQTQWMLLPHVDNADKLPSISQILGEEEQKEEKVPTTKDEYEAMKSSMGY